MKMVSLLIALMALPASTSAANGPIMLDFTATWCGPCRQVKPALDQLIKSGYPIKAVDIDTSPDLAERYHVTGVPTFIVIEPATGRELGRTSGNQPAAQLASFYNSSKAKLKPRATAESEHVNEDREQSDDQARKPESPGEDDPEFDRDAASPNPKPWETVVRIKVHGNGTIGFGSGTLISSTPEESIILTCAHIFKMEGRKQAQPDRFPLRITVDLFDGVLGGQKRSQVHYAGETFEGKAIDYDFSRDVGLIRIRPGRRLPYARVVPTYWQPKKKMGMITVGCSEGHDATAWNTVILNDAMKGLNGNGAYEAVECAIAPKQGRSGGGLFTSDGYIAGVCDFAEPRGNVGLYASPSSIYAILDRNELAFAYSPTRKGGGTILAKAGRRPQNRIERAQSPEREERNDVSLPAPGMMGITVPSLAENDVREAAPKRQAWQSIRSAQAADFKLDQAADPDRFDEGAPIQETPAAKPESVAPTNPEPVRGSGRRGSWRPGREPLPEIAGATSN